MLLLSAVCAPHLGTVVSPAAILGAVFSSAVGTFCHVLAGSGYMPVGLAMEALRKPSGAVVDLTCVHAEIFQEAFLKKLVCRCWAEEVQMQC